MAQVVFSFATTDIIKVTAGVSTATLNGNFVIGGVCYQGSAKGIGARITCLGSGRTIFNGVADLTNGHIDTLFPRGYRAATGMRVSLSSGEMEIYLL
jgi:uncharacterized membrane protein YjjP (DUF1212 family)